MRDVPRRSMMEIEFSILIAIKNGSTKPTNLWHDTNSSWVYLQSALKQLIKIGLVIDTVSEKKSLKGKVKHRYTLTPEGHRTVAIINELKSLLPPHVYIIKNIA